MPQENDTPVAATALANALASPRVAVMLDVNDAAMLLACMDLAQSLSPDAPVGAPTYAALRNRVKRAFTRPAPPT